MKTTTTNAGKGRKLQRTILSSCVFFWCASMLLAQPALHGMRVINNWPTIEVYFMPTCNGEPLFLTDTEKLRVFENGVEVGALTLWCQDGGVGRSSISVSLVLETGGQMTGQHMSDAKWAANFLLDMLDGVMDQAALITFSTTAAVVEPMTSSRRLLQEKIDSIQAAGSGSALWDGIYAGVNEIVNNAKRLSRAVVVFTTGKDSGSVKTFEEVLAYVQEHRVRVYVIALDMGEDSELLKLLAVHADRYLDGRPMQASMLAMQENIVWRYTREYPLCQVVYNSRCKNGTKRIVTLELRDVCEGKTSATGSYTAPRDTSTFRPLRISLGTAYTAGNRMVSIPMTLLDTLQGGIFPAAKFDVRFDKECMSFVGVSTPPRTLYEDIPVIVTPSGGRVEIQTTQGKSATGIVPLAYLHFQTSDPEISDTLCCDLKFQSAVFEFSSCYRPAVGDGRIYIAPRMPKLTCNMTGPGELVWDPTLQEYQPNPLTVRMELSNIGQREARNVKFKIDYDKNDFVPVTPVNDTQSGVFQSLQPGVFMEAQWDLLAKRRPAGDTVAIGIVASFDNHEDVACVTQVFVPAGFEPPTSVDGSQHKPGGNALLQNYPNPFTTLTVIEYQVPVAATVRLSVFDVLGRLVRELVHDVQQPGRYSMPFRPADRGQGVYFYRLEAGGFVLTRRMSTIR